MKNKFLFLIKTWDMRYIYSWWNDENKIIQNSILIKHSEIYNKATQNLKELNFFLSILNIYKYPIRLKFVEIIKVRNTLLKFHVAIRMWSIYIYNTQYWPYYKSI